MRCPQFACKALCVCDALDVYAVPHSAILGRHGGGGSHDVGHGLAAHELSEFLDGLTREQRCPSRAHAALRCGLARCAALR
eukprot:366039-Chlamydomonas_euryale.AAC.9